MTSTPKIREGATHYLVGVRREAGVCDHCGRSLTRRFIIADATGRQMTVGRTHAAQFTGYTPTVADAEREQYLTDREAAWQAYLTRSTVGRRLDAAADAEITAMLAYHTDMEARVGRACERPTAGVLATARCAAAENLVPVLRGGRPKTWGVWDDDRADEWAAHNLDSVRPAHLAPFWPHPDHRES